MHFDENDNRSHPKNEHELLNIYLSVTPEERQHLFVSTSTAASKLGISQRTVELWIEHGNLLAIRAGRNYQIYLPDVHRYVAKCSNVSIVE
jgi:excisionase family DNA binding protein